MGMELPAASAVVARLANPEINLAAFGGVVFPLSMIVEAPIIMLLSASTALCRDWRSYLLVRRFMLAAGGLLTLLHVAVAFTPLFDLVVGTIIGAPPPIREPARLGLMIMTPWTLSIAYRRFQQGVLIRHGRSRLVGIGTAVRLGTDVVVLAVGYALARLPGVAVGTLAVACGVMAEAGFIGLAVRPVLRHRLRPASPVDPPLTFRAFLTFYVPLAMTPLLSLLAQPIGSAGMSRMPLAIESLAAWPVVNGLVFTLRSVGLAFNEVVVAYLDRFRPVPALRRFALGLAATTVLALLVVAATPVSKFWFVRVSALSPPLATLARQGLWLAILLPGLSVYQSWYQGSIVHSRRTRGITESVVVFLVATSLVLAAGIITAKAAGLHVAVAGMLIGSLAQVTWLRFRAAQAVREVVARDDAVMAGGARHPAASQPVVPS